MLYIYISILLLVYENIYILITRMIDSFTVRLQQETEDEKMKQTYIITHQNIHRFFSLDLGVDSHSSDSLLSIQEIS